MSQDESRWIFYLQYLHVYRGRPVSFRPFHTENNPLGKVFVTQRIHLQPSLDEFLIPMKNIAAPGLVFAIAGAALDFASGYFVLSDSMMSTNKMGAMIDAYTTSGIVWGIRLFALGVLLLVTAPVTLTSPGVGHIGIFGVLMIVYGIIMLLVGSAMSLRVTPMMNGILSSLGIFVTLAGISPTPVIGALISGGSVLWIAFGPIDTGHLRTKDMAR